MAKKQLPKIFVWCNGCSPQWHNASAITEDGFGIGGHVCSSHGFIAHDMGVDKDGWKRDIYAKYYPDGFEVEYVDKEEIRNHPGLTAALDKNQAMTKKEHEKKGEVLKT